jgi:Ca2+-binding RTX toxin-like protein
MANLPPEVDLNGAAEGFGSSANYSEYDFVTRIAPDATATDSDSANFAEGGLLVEFTSGGTADDQLRVAGEDFFVEEAQLYYQGTAIGSISGGTDGSTPLLVIFNENVTPAIAAALIRAIGYVNFSATPVPGERQISFRLGDGDGGISVARTATVNVTAADTPAEAVFDTVSTRENVVGTGSLFVDNGHGADNDPDGPALRITKVNGSEDNLGKVLTLDSGALLTVYADGTYSYDPNGKFDNLADGGTGASNSSVLADVFTYELEGGSSTSVEVIVTGAASPGDRLMGDSGDNSINGTPGPDIFVLSQGGDDRVNGLGGDDVFYFGGALTAQDVVAGGGGYDTLVLQGDYSGGLVLDGDVTRIEAISMLAGSNQAFGDPGTGTYDYSIKTHDSNFVAGLRAKINGSALLAGEDFTFDGSAETDATFLVYGGGGKDFLTGGRGNDIFFFDSGDFAAGDRVNGGAGYDGLFLRGTGPLDFSDPAFAGVMTGIENLTLTSATDERYARGGASEFDYNLILADENVAQGHTLTVSGALLTAGETMVVVGSRETDGQLRLFGGAANDTLIGGANADLILGNLGADEITGGGGSDSFRYQSTAESSGAAGATDRILDFTPGIDRIELDRIDADTRTPGDQAFTWIGSEAFSGTAGELRVYGSGPFWIVEGDVDGDGRADLYIALDAHDQAPPGAGDFVL